MLTFKNDRGKVIGILDNGVYEKRVRKSDHLLRVMDAWGIDTKIIKELAKAKCAEIRIIDSEEGKVYSASLLVFETKGIVRNFGNDQTFLPRRYFTVEAIHMG